MCVCVFAFVCEQERGRGRDLYSFKHFSEWSSNFLEHQQLMFSTQTCSQRPYLSKQTLYRENVLFNAFLKFRFVFCEVLVLELKVLTLYSKGKVKQVHVQILLDCMWIVFLFASVWGLFKFCTLFTLSVILQCCLINVVSEN